MPDAFKRRGASQHWGKIQSHPRITRAVARRRGPWMLLFKFEPTRFLEYIRRPNARRML